jgi:hypothetical protein
MLCQWVLRGFHRYFAVFFGFCPIYGTNAGFYREFAGLADLIARLRRWTMGAARAKREVMSRSREGRMALSAGRVAETPHWRQRRSEFATLNWLLSMVSFGPT